MVSLGRGHMDTAVMEWLAELGISEMNSGVYVGSWIEMLPIKHIWSGEMSLLRNVAKWFARSGMLYDAIKSPLGNSSPWRWAR
jgi:hypothetical protein